MPTPLALHLVQGCLRQSCSAFPRPRLNSLALPRPLPRSLSFGLLRRLHRASLHSMFARFDHFERQPHLSRCNLV